ncbi:MAG: BatA domain-containing protein [Planctomycetaceae bacterium]|nr:BatA domain-containing protein [Planctomycetaceae bacterium]
MTFLNSALLWGLGLAAIPIMLHLLMRQKPKKLVFPALKLLQQRKKQSVRRLRMRHFWLMLIRVLALAFIVFAIARPSLPPANYALTGWETGTLFVVCLLGVMGYFAAVHRMRQHKTTRFQFEQKKSTARNWATVGTLIALLLLVGWPYQRRVFAEIKDPAPSTDLNLPVAGIMVFDNSLSMSYLQEGKTALDQARRIAKAHLQSLPNGSRIAVAETSNDHPILFQSTILSAQTRIDSLEISPVSLPLDDRLRDALRAHDEDRDRTIGDQSDVDEKLRKDRYIRRVYLFTDLTRAAWRRGGNSLLKSDLEKAKGVNVYVLDAGREQPENLSVMDLELSRQRIPTGGDLIVTSVTRAQGMDVENQTLELVVQQDDGAFTKMGQTTVTLDNDLPSRNEFPVLSGLTDRWIHGQARLVTTDPLSFDNSRHFTVEVKEAPPVLVIGPDRKTAREWMYALAPLEGVNESQNKFHPEFESIATIPDLTLSDYPAITLINCPSLSDDDWFALGKYVENGGGLIVILGGMELQPPAYNRAQAQVFLPAEVDVYRSESDWRFSIDDRNHPLFWKFRQLENYGSFAILENDVVVNRFRVVHPAEGANVLATFSDVDRSPAIIERAHGKGRVLMLATGTDLPDNYRMRWTNLASPTVSSWLFIAFVEQATEYVSRFTDERHIFTAGDTIPVYLEAEDTERTFLLKQPELKQSRQVIPANEDKILIEGLTDLGSYELYDPNSKQTVAAFSINADTTESDLTKLTKEDLNDLLGEDRYQIARNLEELKDDINAADIGQEIYPMLLMLVVVLFCGEHLVANRFYETSSEIAGAGSP